MALRIKKNNYSFFKYMYLLIAFANNTVLRVLHAASSSTVVCFSKGIDGLNGTNITTIVATNTIVRGNRFFSEWKEKMDFGRCVIGTQAIKTTSTCRIPINVGLITFQLNQCIRSTAYSTFSTLFDHTID